MDDFCSFRYCVREKDKPYIKFEIFAVGPNEFDVRFPDYDYIKNGPGMCVKYNREQLLLFLLAYDEKQCLDFIKTLHRNMGSDERYIEELEQNPVWGVRKSL